MDWYIDAWDARGGRAFASQRQPLDDSNHLGPLNERATIYVGPPAFQPEFIVNAAAAYSAGRAGQFDQRVPLEGREFAFPTAQAVADFVRRGFIFRGRGRSGGGGIAVPELGPDDPEGSPSIESGLLEHYCAEMAREIAELDEEKSDCSEREFRFLENIGAGPSPWDHTETVLYGAGFLIGTVLEAFPRQGSNEGIRIWEAAALSLHRALDELDIWTALSTRREPPSNAGTVQSHLDGLMQRFWRQSFPAATMPDASTKDTNRLISVLLTCQPSRIPDFPDEQASFWSELFYWPHPHYGILAPANSWPDRFEPMFSWPLPRYARYSQSGQPPPISVGQLLADLVAAPDLFANADRRVFAIVDFAAAALSSRIADRSDGYWRQQAAKAWLIQSLPRWIFSSEVTRTMAAVPVAEYAMQAR